MSDGRHPGRYNLHRLGWVAFEDLSMQVMRVVLGETCTRFRPGADGGRDGWFQGVPTGFLSTQHTQSGKFIVQCKHTSRSSAALTPSGFEAEAMKIKRLATASAFHYILLTNRQVSAPTEEALRASVEAIPGVLSCTILGESWIEDSLDSHPRLLRLVPRLYGIGDLSQIVAFTIAQQTMAILEDLAPSLKTYVPTESYRLAEDALHKHRFLVLVGPPASGKSTIAANLCSVYAAQDQDVRVLRIEDADQFKASWSPADHKTIYWVDDVFGETTLDADRLKEWGAALDKIEAARKRGARVIFCTRDYILAAAEVRLKRNRVEIINDARVRVNVSHLSTEERSAILYSHVKLGDLESTTKTQLKPHLEFVARMPELPPESARRLGNRRFHRNLECSRVGLAHFVLNPVEHFADVVHGLSNEETAALAICVLYGNAVPAPLPEDSVSALVCDNFGVSRAAVADALETLEGSLVKQVRAGTRLTWQLHHPSMFEALQAQFGSTRSRLELFVSGARPNALLRDTTTHPDTSNTHLIFLPETVYPQLITRLASLSSTRAEALAEYLVERASDKLLWMLQAESPLTIDRAVAATAGPDGTDPGARLAIRLHMLGGERLMPAGRGELLRLALLGELHATGWSGWLEVSDISLVLPNIVSEVLAQESQTGWSSPRALVAYWDTDTTTSEEVRSVHENLEAHTQRLYRHIEHEKGFDPSEASRLRSLAEELLARLEHEADSLEASEAEQAQYDEDRAQDGYYSQNAENGAGYFSDVDE